MVPSILRSPCLVAAPATAPEAAPTVAPAADELRYPCGGMMRSEGRGKLSREQSTIIQQTNPDDERNARHSSHYRLTCSPIGRIESNALTRRVPDHHPEDLPCRRDIFTRLARILSYFSRGRTVVAITRIRG